MMDTPKYSFVAIEGNIGAGKTTLAKMLSETYALQLILEEFADNPFLPLFYKNPDRHAFTVELFFMAERHKQLQEALMQPNLFNSGTISDYIFTKTLLFARQNLSEEEFRLFQRLFKTLNANFRQPDLILYLHRPVPKLLENIKKRGRSFETDIQATYLQQIQDAYFEYFKSVHHIPIVLVNAEELDFVADEEHYKLVQEQLFLQHKPGINHISFL